MRKIESYVKGTYNGIPDVKLLVNTSLYKKFRKLSVLLDKMKAHFDKFKDSRERKRPKDFKCPYCGDSLEYCECYRNTAVEILEKYGKNLMIAVFAEKI